MSTIGELVVKLTAQDFFSGVINRAGEQTRKLGQEAEEVEKKHWSLGSVVRSVFSGIGSIVGKVFDVFKWGVLAVGGLVASFVTFAATSAAVAANLKAVQGKFDAVFKEAGPKTEATLKAVAEATNRSATELKKLASQAQDTLVPMGFSRDKAAEMSIAITRLAADLAAFNAGMSDEEAFERLMAGMIGSTEGLRKFGVIINEVSLNQELLKMGIKGGAEAASEQAKMIARLNLTLAGTSDAHGYAEKTAGSFLNVMSGVWATIKGITANVGQMFLPAMEKIAGFFLYVARIVRDQTADLGGWAGTFEQAASIAIQWGERLVEIFMNWDLLSKTARAAFELFGEAAKAILEWIWQGAWDGMKWFIDNARAYWEHFINDLIGGVKQFANEYSKFLNWVDEETTRYELKKYGWSQAEIERQIADLRKAREFNPSAFAGSKAPDLAALPAWSNLKSLMDEVDKKVEERKREQADRSKTPPMPSKFSANGVPLYAPKPVEAPKASELVGASELFAKNLKDVMDLREERKMLLMQQQAAAAAASVKEQKETNATLRDLNERGFNGLALV